MCLPHHMVYVTVVVFVCPYVCTTLAPTECLVASLWCQEKGFYLILDTSKIPRRSYHLLLHRGCIALREVFLIYRSILTTFLMSQFSLFLVPLSCINVLVQLMRWTHTTIHVSRILHWKSSGWHNVVGYGCLILLLWGWQLLIFGKCFALGLRGMTMTSSLASGNSRKELLLIASVILSQHKQGLRQRTYLPLMALITKALCIPFRYSTIQVLLLAIQISAQYQISRLLLLQILLLAIRIQMKFNRREGGIMGRLGVTTIVVYLM